MYYHIRWDRVRHNGKSVLDPFRGWSFRSLRNALNAIRRTYGDLAKYWRIEYLTDPTTDLMSLEETLKDALLSTHQFIILTFKDDCPAIDQYDHYEFFVCVRDEKEKSPTFAFPEDKESEAVVQVDQCINLDEHPIIISWIRPESVLYGKEKGVCNGIAVQLIDGGILFVSAGKDDKGNEVDLNGHGIEASEVSKVDAIKPQTPSFIEISTGFLMCLKSGDKLTLNIARRGPGLT